MTGRPYNTLSDHLRSQFGKKLRKICIDGGFTCPNRDGTCGVGGCVFCGERGAGEQLDPTLSIRRQVQQRLEQAAPEEEWIAYFQNFTNTYAPVDVLRARYDAALCDPRIRVLDIGTRPDCITEEIAALLASYQSRCTVWVELGLQTANESTAQRLNRGYDNDCFTRAVSLLKKYHIPIITHIIIGLPGENREDILNTVEFLNRHKINGIKIHSLFIMKNTALADWYAAGDFTPITMQQYIEWAMDVLTHLAPEVIVHRLHGNCLRALLVAPDWIIRRDAILYAIHCRMQQNGWRQGCFHTDTVPCETAHLRDF